MKRCGVLNKKGALEQIDLIGKNRMFLRKSCMSHLFHIVFVSVSIFRIVFNVCVLEVAVVERRRQCKIHSECIFKRDDNNIGVIIIFKNNDQQRQLKTNIETVQNYFIKSTLFIATTYIEIAATTRFHGWKTRITLEISFLQIKQKAFEDGFVFKSAHILCAQTKKCLSDVFKHNTTQQSSLAQFKITSQHEVQLAKCPHGTNVNSRGLFIWYTHTKNQKKIKKHINHTNAVCITDRGKRHNFDCRCRRFLVQRKLFSALRWQHWSMDVEPKIIVWKRNIFFVVRRQTKRKQREWDETLCFAYSI